MQSRREKDYGTRSSMAARLRDPTDIDPYLMPSREVMERYPRPRRSLSPPGRVVGSGERRGGSFEDGRDLGWQAGGWNIGAEREYFGPNSPRFGRMYERWRNYDEGLSSRDELRRKYQFCDALDYKDEFDPGLDHGNFRDNVDRERVLHNARDQLSSGKPRALGSMYHEEYRSQSELEYISRHAEDAGRSSLSSRNLENSRSNNENIGYPDPFLLEKLLALQKREEYTTQSRDASYSKGSASLSKDNSQLKEFAGISSRSLRENMMGCYQDNRSLPIEVHPRCSAQPVEQYTSADVHQRHSLGTRRNSEANHDDLLRYKRAAFSPLVVEGSEQDYLYSKNGFRENYDYTYPSEELHRKRHHHDDVAYYQRDAITSSVMEPNGQDVIHASSQRGLRSSNSWDSSSSKDQLASKYHFPNRSLAAVDELARPHMDPENANPEFDHRVLGETEASMLNFSPNDGLSQIRTTRNSNRDAICVSARESMRSSSDNRHQIEMRDLRKKAIFLDEPDGYDPPRRSLKRKYDINEEWSRHRTRGTLLGNTYDQNNSKYQNQRDEEQNHQDAMNFLPSKSLEYNSYDYRGAGRKDDFVDYDGDMTSDDQWLYCDPEDYKQKYSGKPFKPEKRIVRGRPRHGFLDSHNSKTLNKRCSLAQNVWLGKDSKELDESAFETQESKNWVSSSESGPPEGSKDFKELVQAFFLSFSKMLNKNLGTRNRYKEQGKAGSLFCIVCGKSQSAEFKATQNLATHCFMSKKVGLRAQHLGLHKAICVLLGWSTVVGADVITFTPQAISSSEALAQKEDLILWPPVVIIHSISTSASHPKGQKVFTEEAVEDFLRGNGFSVKKIKVRPGMSANNIMVVKFLGTFPGLRDAEKLHKCFLEDKHGRLDFEQMCPVKGQDNNKKKERMQADKFEEYIRYGYMAISEDLDKVDFETKRKCSVKSRREIEDIAEEPLKL